jgi:hypothetical protein
MRQNYFLAPNFELTLPIRKSLNEYVKCFSLQDYDAECVLLILTFPQYLNKQKSTKEDGNVEHFGNCSWNGVQREKNKL